MSPSCAVPTAIVPITSRYGLTFAKLGWFPSSGQADTLQGLDIAQHAHTNIYLLDALINGSWGDFTNVLQHLFLPALTLGLLICGVFIRLVRVNIIQTLKNDYIEAARARGISETRVVLRHGFRNALVPVVTVIGLQAALLLSGAVLTETTSEERAAQCTELAAALAAKEPLANQMFWFSIEPEGIGKDAFSAAWRISSDARPRCLHD